MKLTGSNRIAYKWLSWVIVLVAVYFWIITVGLVLFPKPVASVTPRQTLLYRTFFRQNWRLFAITKEYNRKMNFIVRDRNNPQKADTTDLVKYLLVYKRKYAPFNNYEDALDRVLYLEMNDVEILMNFNTKKLKDSMPGKPGDFYFEQACKRVNADSIHQQHINNLLAYGKYMMRQEKKDTTGKEYQLCIIHDYIPPAKPKVPIIAGGSEQLVFISNYKPL